MRSCILSHVFVLLRSRVKKMRHCALLDPLSATALSALPSRNHAQLLPGPCKSRPICRLSYPFSAVRRCVRASLNRGDSVQSLFCGSPSVHSQGCKIPELTVMTIGMGSVRSLHSTHCTLPQAFAQSPAGCHFSVYRLTRHRTVTPSKDHRSIENPL